MVEDNTCMSSRIGGSIECNNDAFHHVKFVSDIMERCPIYLHLSSKGNMSKLTDTIVNMQVSAVWLLSMKWPLLHQGHTNYGTLSCSVTNFKLPGNLEINGQYHMPLFFVKFIYWTTCCEWTHIYICTMYTSNLFNCRELNGTPRPSCPPAISVISYQSAILTLTPVAPCSLWGYRNSWYDYHWNPGHGKLHHR